MPSPTGQPGTRVGDLRRISMTVPEAARILKVGAGQDRVVPIDEDIAKLWGEMLGQHDKNRFEVCLAATAITRDMVVATRNTRDFRGRGACTVNLFSKNPIVERPSR